MRKSLILISIVTLLFANITNGQKTKPATTTKTQAVEPVSQTKTYDQAINDLASKIISSFKGNQKSSIAVLGLRDVEGAEIKLGKFLAEELTTKFFEANRFENIVERSQLERIIQSNLQDVSDFSDPKNAQKLGQLAGVSAVVLGSTTTLGSVIRVNARIVDTQLGRVIGAAQTEFSIDERIKPLLQPSAPTSTPVTSQNNSTNNNPSKPANAVRRGQVSDFVLEVKKCQKNGVDVYCDLALTNKEADVRLNWIRDETYIIDENGNQTRVNGGKTGSNMLPTNIAVPVSLIFPRFSPKATKISVLSFYLSVGIPGNTERTIVIKDIPLFDEAGNNLSSSSNQNKTENSSNSASINIPANKQWTDSEIDVSPGMTISISANGKVYFSAQKTSSSQNGQNTVIDDLLAGVMGGGAKGTDKLLMKIVYADGGESMPVKVGSNYQLKITKAGRIHFGIDDKKFEDNSGEFEVNVSW